MCLSWNTDAFCQTRRLFCTKKKIFLDHHHHHHHQEPGWIYSPPERRGSHTLIFLDQMSFPSSPSPTCSLLSVSLICTLIQAPLAKANFIKVVSWIKNEGVYFALWSAPMTAEGLGASNGSTRARKCEKRQQNQRWFDPMRLGGL